MKRISIAFLIESLGPGGAERQLTEMVRHLDLQRFDPQIYYYMGDHFFRSTLDQAGIPSHFIPRGSRWDLGVVSLLQGRLHSRKTDIIHAYLYTSNLYAAMARLWAQHGRVIASERLSLVEEPLMRRFWGSWAFRLSDLVIANSQSAAADLVSRFHVAPHKAVCIPNGLDLDEFSPPPSETEREILRKRLALPVDRKIFLTVASMKPQKNHLGILDALEQAILRYPDILCCWAGAREPSSNARLIVESIESKNLADRVHMLGPVKDVVSLYRACDFLILNSFAEGTPNALIEALACGLPAIATQVADAARYVIPGHTGWLIPAGNADALKNAMVAAASLPMNDHREYQLRCRRHAESLGLDMRSVAQRHEQIYLRLADQP